MLGVAEQFSPYLNELEAIVVWYGLMALLYARLGQQVVAISIEDRDNALVEVRDWLKRKQAELQKAN